MVRADGERVSRATRFLAACRREPTDCTPVWFMRQAGRYLEEYRALRARHSMLELCRTPELAARVTLQPVERFDVDAAILFADLLLPLESMGRRFDFFPDDGPKVFEPVRTAADVASLRVGEPREDLAYVLEAARLARREIAGRVPLIGFGGAPFTLASYLVEGGKSSSFARTKRLMYEAPGAWHTLCEKLAEVVSRFLVAQIEAGADAVQLFDSWVGHLSPADYREYVLPHSARVFAALRGTGVPAIHFATGNPTLLPLLREAGGDVIGVDWRIDLGDAWRMIGDGVAVQGNLEPAALLAPAEVLARKVRAVLDGADGRPGHVFNLGHGILPQTPVENVAEVIRLVHTWTAR
jgi:uroporphyrinogen decarboxylase